MKLTNKYLENGTILVTGAAGLIGSALIWHLNKLGYSNILASDFLDKDNKFLNLVPLQFSDYIEADDLINMVNFNDKKLRNISCVFHLGACSHTTEQDCRYLIKNNYEYTKSLAQYAVNNNIRFIYASSAATYGNGENGMDDDDNKINILRPLNMYAYSKQLFDLYAQKNNFLNKIYGMKYFNVFGPNEYHKENMRSMVLKSYEQILNTGKVKLFRSYNSNYLDGQQMRDFLYIKDAVKMTTHLAKIEDSENYHGGIFNLGSGKANTWIDLISPVFEAMNTPVIFEFIDMPEDLRNKYQYYTCANISKFRNTGYYEEITSLHDAVIDYTKNYLISGRITLN